MSNESCVNARFILWTHQGCRALLRPPPSSRPDAVARAGSGGREPQRRRRLLRRGDLRAARGTQTADGVRRGREGVTWRSDAAVTGCVLQGY